MGLALTKAKSLGIEAVRMTCRDDNPTSRQIIEAHGAVWLQDFVCRRGTTYHLFETCT
jgi:predicted acetyltransferase